MMTSHNIAMMKRWMVTWVNMRRSFAAQPRVEHKWTTIVEEDYDELPVHEKVEEALTPQQQIWIEGLPEHGRVPFITVVKGYNKISTSNKEPRKLPTPKVPKKPPSVKAQKKHFEDSMGYFMNRLNLSKKEFYKLTNHNMKLRQFKDFSKLDDKLDVLLASGVDVKDICSYSQVLTNVSAATLRKRVEEMQRVGYQNPLPANVLAASHRRFTAMLEKYTQGRSQQHEDAVKQTFLEKVQEKKIRMSYPGRNLSVLKLKPKVDFLESKGFEFEDIISHQVIGLTVPNMKEALDRLHSYGVEDISLSTLFLFARYRRINSSHKSSLAPISWILGVEEKTLRGSIPNNLRKYFTLQRTDVFVRNYKALTEYGFSKEVIQGFSIILCHHPEILQRQLAVLKQKDDLPDGLVNDEGKLLNVLQFYIEKERNFSQPVLVNAKDNGESKEEVEEV